MDYLARKFQRAKWDIHQFMNHGDIQADAIGGCLRTSSNNLSFWYCHKTQEDIKEVALAIAADFDTLQKMHLIIFKYTDITDQGFQFEHVPGRTPIQELRDRHLDLVHLTVDNLASFAHFMKVRVRNDIDCHFFTRDEVRTMLSQAIASGRLQIDDLNEKIRPHFRSEGELKKVCPTCGRPMEDRRN